MKKANTAPKELIKRISSVTDKSVQSNFENVIVIEVKTEDEIVVACRGVAQWRIEDPVKVSSKNKIIYNLEMDKALATGLKKVTGGNPRCVVGNWGMPAYLVYNGDIRDIKSSKLKTKDFIEKRLAATVDTGLSCTQIPEVAEKSAIIVDNIIANFSDDQVKSTSMIIFLLLLNSNSSFNPYRLANIDDTFDNKQWGELGLSQLLPGKKIMVNYDSVAKRIIEAKTLEAKSKGTSSQGVCGICGARDDLVSPYCKQWPWLSFTWSCPFPVSSLKNNKVNDLSKAVVALCNDCSQALDLGAGVLKKLEKRLYNTIIQDIFSAYEGPNARKAKGQTKEGITGLMFALPILDSTLETEEALEKYITGLNKMIDDKNLDRNKDYLRDILGFNAVLPEELQDDQYRLTIIYYSGERDKGVIYTRSAIEDVIPSQAKEISKIMKKLQITADIIGHDANLPTNTVERAKRNTECLLPLLARAYGSAFVFSTLNKVLKGQKLDEHRFVHGVANRMNNIMSKSQEDKNFNLLEETLFYLLFRNFLKQYKDVILKESDEMQTWKELDNLYESQEPRSWEFKNVEELGYVCGRILREFSIYYWSYMNEKRGKSDADFIKDRIMTFGTRLTPETIWKRGLGMIEDYRLRFDLKLSNNFREKNGVALSEYSRLNNQVAQNKDLFMASFWSGYALGFRRKEKTEANEEVKLSDIC